MGPSPCTPSHCALPLSQILCAWGPPRPHASLLTPPSCQRTLCPTHHVPTSDMTRHKGLP